MTTTLSISMRSRRATGVAESRHPGLWRRLVAAYLPALGPTGARLVDVSARRFHGVLGGATWQAGQRGTTLGFAGAGNVAINPAALLAAYPFTVCSWFRTASADADQVIVAHHHATTANNRVLLYWTGSTLRYNVRGATEAEISAGGGWNDGRWHFAVGVSRAANAHELYVDGSLRGTSTTSVTFPALDRCWLADWQSTAISGQQLIGELGFCAWWARALTASELRTLWHDELALVRRRASVRAGQLVGLLPQQMTLEPLSIGAF